MSAPDHYSVLGVAPTADAETIRAAARRLQLQHHPDRTRLLPAAEQAASQEAFLRVTAAWEALGDPKSRAAYDRARVRVGGETLQDLVERLWRWQAPPTPSRGADVTALLVVPTMTSIHGGPVSFEGRSLRVPAGVAAGDTVRVPGAGAAGSPPGDLLLEVRLEPRGPQSLIWRDGDDVHLRLRVSWWEALHRGRFTFHTPWELLETELPASVAAGGAELRVQGHGARPRARPPGWLVAHVELVPPQGDPLVMMALEAAHYGPPLRAELERALDWSWT